MFKDLNKTTERDTINVGLPWLPGGDRFIKVHVPPRDPNKKTAYLIGTGPSLKQIDMSKLKNKESITFNRAYIAFEDWGFDPTYYLCIDSQDLLSTAEDIKKIATEGKVKHLFLPYDMCTEERYKNLEFDTHDHITFLQGTPEATQIVMTFASHTPLTKHNILVCPMPSSAGFMGLKMLYLMGYQEVALLGCDVRYNLDDASQKDVVWDEDGCVSTANTDTNHFREDYYGKGQRFGRPGDHAWNIRIWTCAQMEINELLPSGFKVYSCSKGSNINHLFPYIPFEDFINGKRE